VLGLDLVNLGFQVEASKRKVDMLERPAFFGENGVGPGPFLPDT
jgi:hypothetical protein